MKTHQQITILATVKIQRDDDVSRVRRVVAREAMALGFGTLDRTRLITATSELARNMLTYGGGGEARVERIDASDGTTALQISFDDLGPGIEDVEQALSDGYSTGLGLGLGLSGARRLVDDFTIDSEHGVGTRISISRWLKPVRPQPQRSTGP